MTALGPLQPLAGNQLKAVSPQDTVWLSASAGTGKTHVLTSRVLRLLLRPEVEPSQILCLTFTKAGAAEMAERIRDRLARWVRLEDTALQQELEALGADPDPALRARARTLFASVLDCPGGGLRIDTIHAFAQWLLGAFPLEAGLPPGARAMEDRERALLSRQVLADVLTTAENDPLGDPTLISALTALSLRLEPKAVEAFLLRCAEAREAWFGPGGWQEPMRPNVHRLLGLDVDADEASVVALCDDDRFDVASLRRCMEINAAWKAATGQKRSLVISTWLAAVPGQRLAGLDVLADVFLTGEGEPRSTTSLDKIDPAYRETAARVIASIVSVRDQRALLALAERLVSALRLGRAFAFAWDEAKTREGLIDFDDQIRRAAELLHDSAYAPWIGYKLDRRFDHILVDEAQDTNAAQWRIIDALTGEFFSGLGQRGDRLRTLFVVGDYKQAIFRFQGTSPENFRLARDRVRGKLETAQDNAASLRSHPPVPRFEELDLGRSFRTTKPVLDFVDRAIAEIGHEQFGLDKAPEAHQGDTKPGLVTLWQPVGNVPGESAEEDSDEQEASWLSRPDRSMADKIARQVRVWMDQGFPLIKGGARRAGPGDVMVLVRKRRELAGLIVARLHAAGVPVAGVDRLRLGAPLVVRDLIAALRFAAQPFDCLNLACLLVSPLIGWSQEQLLQHGYRGKDIRLWDHLRRSIDPEVTALLEQLRQLLAKADFTPPQALLHWLLVGPWQGRRRLVARLGLEADDPIDELLNAAQAYAQSATPSLVGFLHWFDAGDGDIKREADNAAGQVRVMTVHGAKGLQAPIVILADAASDPDKGPGTTLDLADPANTQRIVPLPPLRKEERIGRVAARHALIKAEEEQEHWRLLYVAMTRTEEALFIGGGLETGKEEPAAKSWYAALRKVFGSAEPVEQPIWGHCWEWGVKAALSEAPPGDSRGAEQLPLPAWLSRPAPEEPRPPRPLSPSALGEDLSVAPPEASPDLRRAAQRGVLIHKLLERLPALDPMVRPSQAAQWLNRNGADFTPDERDALLASTLAVLDHPGWQDLFAPDALAEVSIAAPVGEQVVAGVIDRLLVSEDRVRFVDFKTGRAVPASAERVPVAILRQMAAYAAALEKTFPGRLIEGALLYTAAPRLIALPADLLHHHKADLLATQ